MLFAQGLKGVFDIHPSPPVSTQKKTSANYAIYASANYAIAGSGISAILLKMESPMLTQCLISTIDEAALEKFGDYSKFSRVAWAGYKNQAGTWRAIRNPRKNGKARAIYIEDLICISNALEIPLSELFFRVEQRLKMGWQPTHDASSPGNTREKPSKKAAGSDTELPPEKKEVA